jgi:hypothetical protein
MKLRCDVVTCIRPIFSLENENARDTTYEACRAGRWLLGCEVVVRAVEEGMVNECVGKSVSFRFLVINVIQRLRALATQEGHD